MARLAPTLPTIRLLFARSGNECAFPGCAHELINEKDQFVAQVCHIKAAEKGGPRFDDEQSDEDRRAPENLFLLCYRHHVETDDESEFPVDRMIEIKCNHENRFSEGNFRISDELVAQARSEAAQYWCHVGVLNSVAHSMPELSMSVEADATTSELEKKLDSALSNLEGFIDHICEPLGESREHWESINLAIPNWLQAIRILIIQLQIKVTEAELLAAPTDPNIRATLNSLRARFEEVAQHAICVD